MRHTRAFAVLLTAIFAMIAPATQAQDKPASPPTTATSTAPAADPDIDPAAVEILKKMTDYLSKATNLRIDVSDSIDIMNDEGAMIQYNHERTLLLSRPDKLAAVVEGDLRHDAIFYDGKKLTVWNPTANVYAQIDAPPTVDELLTALREKYGIELPGADIIRSNLQDVVKGAALSIRYIGLHNTGGVSSHHVLVAGPKADWQLWIDAGDKPVLRKIVIQYRERPGRPQCTLIFKSIEVLDTLAPESFMFEPPVSAEKIPFHPLSAKEQAKAASAKEGANEKK